MAASALPFLSDETPSQALTRMRNAFLNNPTDGLPLSYVSIQHMLRIVLGTNKTPKTTPLLAFFATRVKHLPKIVIPVEDVVPFLASDLFARIKLSYPQALTFSPEALTAMINRERSIPLYVYLFFCFLMYLLSKGP
jgi:hypothetical protein